MDTQTSVFITMFLLSGGTLTIAGVLVFLRHRKPWALRNRRRPRNPRQ